MPAIRTEAGPKRRLRLFGILPAAAAGLLLLAAPAASQTVTPQSVDPLQHFIDCAGVLISAPDIHAANCLPNNIPPETNSLGSSVGDDDACVDDAVRDDVSNCYEEPPEQPPQFE